MEISCQFYFEEFTYVLCVVSQRGLGILLIKVGLMYVNIQTMLRISSNYLPEYISPVCYDYPVVKKALTGFLNRLNNQCPGRMFTDYTEKQERLPLK
jgi:hypothetical protein